MSITDSQLQSIGDVNGDQLVTNVDLQAMLNQLKSGGGSISAVPEPGTLTQIGCGTLALCSVVCYRNRRSMMSILGRALGSAFVAVSIAMLPASAAGATYSTINLQTNDMAYSTLTGLLYASVPDGSPTNPDTLTPINPATGALGVPLSVGFNPQYVTVSIDGSIVYAVFGGNLGVQPIALPSQTFGTPFFLTGGPKVNQILAIPGRPNAVVIAARTQFGADNTSVWQDSMLLPDHVGNGAGAGGPDIIAVDRLDGTKGYGYYNSSSSYTNFGLKITATGISASAGALQGVLTGSNVGRIELLGNNLFVGRGEVYSLSPAIQVGAFQGGNFVLDPAVNKLFSITTSGSTQTIRAYSLSNFQQLETDTITGLSVTTDRLVRFGTDGLAFRTSTNNQIILVHSGTVAPTVLGDMNRDGALSAADVPAMISALTNLNGYKTAHNMSDIQLRAVGDVNGDFNPATLAGGVNNADLQALLNLLKSGTMTSVPEPAAISLISIAAAAFMLHRFRRSRLHGERL